MKKEIIKEMTGSFESAAHLADDVEFWYARDLQILLRYSKWDNFVQVIEKAKIACTNAVQEVNNHFADVGKMIVLGRVGR
jgi:DNA-damage-inducible protein D